MNGFHFLQAPVVGQIPTGDYEIGLCLPREIGEALFQAGRGGQLPTGILPVYDQVEVGDVGESERTPEALGSGNEVEIQRLVRIRNRPVEGFGRTEAIGGHYPHKGMPSGFHRQLVGSVPPGADHMLSVRNGHSPPCPRPLKCSVLSPVSSSHPHR